MSADSPTLWTLGDVLSEAFAAVDALLSENDGEYTSEMAALIDEAEEEFTDKALRTGFYADRRIPIEMAGIKAEIRRLQARSRALAKRRAWLREVYLPEALARQGRTQVHSALLTLRISAGRASVVCDIPVSHLPLEFVRLKPAEEMVDKKAIMAAVSRGEKLPHGIRIEKKPVAKVS